MGAFRVVESTRWLLILCEVGEGLRRNDMATLYEKGGGSLQKWEPS